MNNVLCISKDASRLSQLMRLIGECGGKRRTTRTVGTPSQLAQRGDTLQSFDVLIVDAVSLEDTELSVVAEFCHRYEHLTCILLADDASSHTLIAAMRAGFRDVLSWPLDQGLLHEALVRAEAKGPSQSGHDTHVISFMSCKGGTGTTFIASNVAHAISTQWGKQVLLVDLNQLYGDAAYVVTSETPASTLPQICEQIERMDSAFLDASLLHVSETFHVLAGAGDPIKAAEISSDRLEWIIGIALARYDLVIFDIGQAINPLSILALDRSNEIHLVLQATMPHLRAGRRLQEILASLSYPQERMRLLLNRYHRRAQRERAALEEVLGMLPYQVLPDESDIVAEALNEGVPVSAIKRGAEVTRAIEQLAQRIVHQVQAPIHVHACIASKHAWFTKRSATPKLKTT